MHTDELINLMTNNPPPVRAHFLRSVRLQLVCVLLCAIAIVAATLGLRHDLLAVLDDPHRVFKYGFTTVLMVASGLAWWRQGQPGRSAKGPLLFVLLFCGWLLILAVRSFYLSDYTVLKAEVFDYTAFFCVGVTTLLAVGASAVLMRIGRGMAPTDVAGYGYLSALFAASIALFAYALHCPHDAPIYIATWYVLAVAGFTALGGRVLARKLSW